MAHPTYTKGPYQATVHAELLDDGRYQGLVSLERTDERDSKQVHRTQAYSSSEAEAFEEGHALAHRLLADVGNA
ncbi:hypothetical protein OVY01_10420 [Robbsia sp. Bb-Pol-6]|uniref:Uncharacterized protein n=1 Tax=Robbsia betulipollinis TaxID=2981849 RepID=A0ABT3ZM90_9BURK|nr:hypothetical protein [Robbsia betulipollinis]MCY0387640.1 hypothetical protein [Robbsia betulipollinis]